MSLVVLAGSALAFLRPKLGFLAVFVFGILAPSSSVFSIHTEVGADRRFYLPLLAVLAYLVVGAGAFILRSPTPARRRVALALAACAALTLGVTTRLHAASYASTLAVWQQVVRTYPENARGHYNLAETYRRKGDLPRALDRYRAALGLDPAYPDAQVNLGNTLVALGRAGEGLVHLQRGVALAPSDPNARYNLGIALALTGRTDAALRELERVLEANPAHLEARRKLAGAYLALGRSAEARAHAEHLTWLQPADPVAQEVLQRTEAGR